MPKKREVLLEQDALQHIDTGVGGLLEFQLPDGSTKTMPVVGIVQDMAAGAGDFLASPYRLYHHGYFAISGTAQSFSTVLW